MEKYLESKKIKIFINEKIVENSKKAILLIHGLAEHGGRYEEFISRLNEENYSVFAMDLRGHGQTISKRGDCENIKKVISDVDVVIDYIKNNYDFDKVGIFGHSAGGLVTSLYTSLNPNKIDFLVLSSPAIYCPEKVKIIKYLPYKLLPFIYLKKKQSESKEMLEYNRQDKLALQKYSIRTIGTLFNDGINLLNKKLNIPCPTLLVGGKQDILLSEYSNFNSFMNKLTNPKNKIIIYETAKHRIVQNEGSENRIKDIIAWLNGTI